MDLKVDLTRDLPRSPYASLLPISEEISSGSIFSRVQFICRVCKHLIQFDASNFLGKTAPRWPQVNRELRDVKKISLERASARR